MTARVPRFSGCPVAVPVGLPVALLSGGQAPTWRVASSGFAASNDSLSWRLG